MARTKGTDNEDSLKRIFRETAQDYRASLFLFYLRVWKRYHKCSLCREGRKAKIARQRHRREQQRKGDRDA